MKPAIRALLDDTHPRSIGERSASVSGIGAGAAIAMTGEAAAASGRRFRAVERQSLVRTVGAEDHRSARGCRDGRSFHGTHHPHRYESGVGRWGEVRDGGNERYALMLKSRILGENPCNVDKIFRRIKQFGAPARQAAAYAASRWP